MSNPSAEALWFFDGRVTVLHAGAEHGVSVLEHRLPFGAAPPQHVHHDEDEVFFVMEGEVRYVVGGTEHLGRAGDTLFAPAGVPHAFRVVSPQGARVITVSREGFEGFVRDVSRPAVGGGLPPFAEPTPEQQSAAAAIGRKHRIEFLGPPLAA